MKKRVCKLDRDQGVGCCSIAAVSMAIKSGQELDIFHLEEREREELMEGGWWKRNSAKHQTSERRGKKH